MYTYLCVLRNRNDKKCNIFIRNKKFLKNVQLDTIFYEISVTNNRKLDKRIYIRVSGNRWYNQMENDVT